MSRASKTAITDWPDGFVETVRECELHGLTGREELQHLKRHYSSMRGGRFIDLSIEAGFYLEPGNGLVTKPAGMHAGILVGVLCRPVITIDAFGAAEWWANPVQQRYVANGEAMLTWVLANAEGPWLIAIEPYESRAGELWYWLLLRFLDAVDQAAFRAVFPESGR